jgi:uroporphyrinogen decarboxylase
MTSKERVRKAFCHEQPDFTPCDYFGTPEINQALFKHFNVNTLPDLWNRLNTDIRYLEPPYIGSELKHFDNGSQIDIWGVIRKPMPNEYGEYAEPVNLPFAKWTSIEQAEQHLWSSPDWYDYDAMTLLCEKYPDHAVAIGHFGVQDFINGVAFGRGVEQVLMDIALEDPVYLYIVEKRHRFFMEYIDRSLRAAKGRIDFVLCGDDFGQQQGLLISPETFDKIFAAKKKAFFDMVHSHNSKILHHSCGSTRKLIPTFIEVGMDGLHTIQPMAKDMNPYELKAEFGNDILFHGAIDVQGWIQNVTVDQVKAEVNRLIDEMGKGGGYILVPSHNIQPDTPIRNVLAVYETVVERRGVRI